MHSEHSVVRGKDKQRKIYKPAAEKIIKMWEREGIPTLQVTSVARKLELCYTKFRNLNKVKKSQRSEKTNQKMNQQFFRKLYDIALCKCLQRCS